MKILVVGSINMDLVTYMPHLPKRGETSFGTDFIKNPGGKGAISSLPREEEVKLD